MTTNLSACYYTSNSYTPVVAADDGSVEPFSPRTVIRQFKGTTISLTYYIYTPQSNVVIQCPSPTAAYNSAGNLWTVTTFYTNGSFNGWEQSVSNPDGTMSFYSYSTNSTGETDTVSTGQPDSTASYIFYGTQSTTVKDTLGQVYTATMQDVTNGTAGIVTASDTYTNFDWADRAQKITHIDNTTETWSYDCCELSSGVDRDGVTTTYIYDSQKRLLGSIRLGITTQNTLDANGNVLQTVRTGTDSSQITMSQAAYDTAGQVVTETNALNGVTSHAWGFDGNGRYYTTATNPDGGTGTSTYYTDGSVMSVTGTAVAPMRTTNFIASDGGTSVLALQQIKLNSSYGDTTEWTETYQDLLGRNYKTLYAAASGTPYSISYYNSLGQLTNTVDPDGVSTLYAYNPKGEKMLTVVDVNQNGSIDWSGSDRITFTTNDVVFDSALGTNVVRTRTYGTTGISSSASNLLEPGGDADGRVEGVVDNVA